MKKAASGAKEIRVVKEMKTKAKHEIEMEITKTKWGGTMMLLQINKVQSSEAAASTLTLSLDDEEKL